jgi:hypothetical protein
MLVVNFLVWMHDFLFPPCSGSRSIYPHTSLFCLQLRCLRGTYSHQKKIRNKYADRLYYYSWQSFNFSELGVKAVWRSPSGAEDE